MSQSKSILPTLEELVAASQSDTSRGSQRKKWPCLDGLTKKQRKSALNKLHEFLNREHYRKTQKAWIERNLEKRRKSSRAYRRNNPEKAKLIDSAYRKTESRKRSVKSYYDRNKQKCKEAVYRWLDKHPGLRAHYASMRRAKILARESGDAKGKILEIRSRRKNACFYCNKIIPSKDLHIDHYIPLAKGGKHSADNLVPSCASCNLTKNAKHPHEFVKGTLPLFIL